MRKPDARARKPGSVSNSPIGKAIPGRKPEDIGRNSQPQTCRHLLDWIGGQRRGEGRSYRRRAFRSVMSGTMARLWHAQSPSTAGGQMKLEEFWVRFERIVSNGP